MPKCQLGLFEVGRELPTCFPSLKWKAEKVPLCSLQASFCKAKHTQEPIRHSCAVLPRCDWTWQGVTKKFEYKMRLVYAHFPINVNIINGGKVGPQWGLYDTIRVSENMVWQPNITFVYETDPPPVDLGVPYLRQTHPRQHGLAPDDWDS